jgi:hypothetical protein
VLAYILPSALYLALQGRAAVDDAGEDWGGTAANEYLAVAAGLPT